MRNVFKIALFARNAFKDLLAPTALLIGLGLVVPQSAHAYVFGTSGSNPSNFLTTDGGAGAVNFSGWYDQTNSDTGFHGADNPNYIVGKNEDTPFDGSVFHDFLGLQH